MNRLNITIPDDIAVKLNQIHNKSRFIAELLAERFAREEKKKLERCLTEGYKKSYRKDKKLSADWEKADLEEWD